MDTMDTMDIYDRLRTPPSDALKTIKGGRLAGMTDINPQWRYEAMTQVFGVCGIGWKYQIDKSEQVEHDGQIALMVQVSLFIKVDGQWSDPIPGIGGSAIVAKETGGLRLNDEAWKMATTDALSVAMKMVGVGADIYRNKPTTTNTSNTSGQKPTTSNGTNGTKPVTKPVTNGTLTREEWEKRHQHQKRETAIVGEATWLAMGN